MNQKRKAQYNKISRKIDDFTLTLDFRFVTLIGGHFDKSHLQSYTNRLHLWQLLFASPDEWHDQRRSKTNPKQPDFKHKSTGEALWLSASDPPWVKKQVELLYFSRPNNDRMSSCSLSGCL